MLSGLWRASTLSTDMTMCSLAALTGRPGAPYKRQYQPAMPVRHWGYHQQAHELTEGSIRNRLRGSQDAGHPAARRASHTTLHGGHARGFAQPVRDRTALEYLPSHPQPFGYPEVEGMYLMDAGGGDSGGDPADLTCHAECTDERRDDGIARAYHDRGRYS